MELVKLIGAAMRGSDDKVIAKVESLVEEAFEHLRKCDEHEYDGIVREAHEAVHGPHYSEEYAEEDVAKLRYTDAQGNKHEGPHWTKAQVVDATSSFTFPKGTTDCDKYVAFNATYADFCKDFTEEQILKMGYRFWFADEDWKSEGKIWHYMNLNR